MLNLTEMSVAGFGYSAEHGGNTQTHGNGKEDRVADRPKKHTGRKME